MILTFPCALLASLQISRRYIQAMRMLQPILRAALPSLLLGGVTPRVSSDLKCLPPLLVAQVGHGMMGHPLIT
jgi:hypothetical protein